MREAALHGVRTFMAAFGVSRAKTPPLVTA